MKQAARISSPKIESPSTPVAAIEDIAILTSSSSPARELQRRLQMSLPEMGDASIAGRWPPYARTAFVLISAASLWAAIIASVRIGLG